MVNVILAMLEVELEIRSRISSANINLPIRGVIFDCLHTGWAETRSGTDVAHGP